VQKQRLTSWNRVRGTVDIGLQTRQIHDTNQHNSTFGQLPLVLDGEPGSSACRPSERKKIGHDWSPAVVNRNNRELTAGLRFNEPIPSHMYNTVSPGFVQNNLSSLFLLPGVPSWKAERAVVIGFRTKIEF
jgi:hypothetical protein